MYNILFKLFSSVVFLLLAAIVTSCYPAPTCDDCSVIPYVNNPDHTGKASSLMPNADY